MERDICGRLGDHAARVRRQSEGYARGASAAAEAVWAAVDQHERRRRPQQLAELGRPDDVGRRLRRRRRPLPRQLRHRRRRARPDGLDGQLCPSDRVNRSVQRRTPAGNKGPGTLTDVAARSRPTSRGAFFVADRRAVT